MYKHFFKRVIDIIISLIAIPFVILFIIILAPIIYFTDKGPIFYNAERLGKNGKIFKMFKLRSMKVNSPDIKNADGSTYNGKDDARVTKIGKIMRSTSLDEIPQFFNVLIGDMSIIGPRAHLAAGFTRLEDLEEPLRKRLTVRPGITGYNQAYYRNSVTSEQKVTNDNYYIDHLTFIMDIKVFFHTIKTVLLSENVYVDTNGQNK